MRRRNPHVANLQGSYLFAEINQRKAAFLEKNPCAELISLGIGDTTLPLPNSLTSSLQDQVSRLTDIATYEGYGPESGKMDLRLAIASTVYNNQITPEEVYISDGSKPDIGRLQWLFPEQASVAVQDPSYPVYIADSVISGKAGPFDTKTQMYRHLTYMSCTKENDFFPLLNDTPAVDIIYFCNPNNPTGAAATRRQLEELVDFARKNQSIIIYDSAYAPFIRDSSLPKSIYEIPGADEVAIESGSFSKVAGFTGVRLGWTVVPRTLKFSDGTPVYKDWEQIVSTMFNGASVISQAGGLAALANLSELDAIADQYLANAAMLKEMFEGAGYQVYGGRHAPYLWVDLEGESSWSAFDRMLEDYHIITTPGVGFGKSGEGFLRLSAFAHHQSISLVEERFAGIGIN